MNKVTFAVYFFLLFSTVYAGPLAYGICQTGCNALAVACYAAAGTTFGAGNYFKYIFEILKKNIA